MPVVAATLRLLDGALPVQDAARILATIPATPNTYATTTTAPAGRLTADRRRLAVTTTAGAPDVVIVGGELRTVDVESGTVLRVGVELQEQHATGVVVRGIEVEATLPAEFAAAEYVTRTLLLEWTLDGHVQLEPLRVAFASPQSAATVSDVLEIDPTLALQGGERVDLAGYIQRATRDVDSDLAAASVLPERVRPSAHLRDAVAYRAAYLALLASSEESAERRREEFASRYKISVNALIIGQQKPTTVITQDDGAVATRQLASVVRGWT